MMTFKNTCYKELRDIGNNCELAEHERLDRIVNKITSVLNFAFLTRSRDYSKKKRSKHKRKKGLVRQ